MLLTVFGVPTATAARGLHIVRSFFTVMVGEFNLITASTIEELRSVWANITRQNVIYHHEAPAANVVTFFRQAHAPMLLFSDEPVAVAAALQIERGLSMIQSARAASINVSVLEEIWVAPDVMLVNASDHGSLSLSEFIRSLASYLSLPCTDEQIQQIAARLSQQDGNEIDPNQPWVSVPINGEALVVRRALSSEETARLHSYLSSYRSVSAQRQLYVVTWPEEVFVSVDHAGSALSGMLEMTGRQRLLIDGPWFGLPRGRWEATIEFEVADNLMGCVMQVNILAEKILRQGRMALPVSGRHVCTLAFDHDDPHIALVVLFSLDRGVLQGRFRLSRVTLQKLPAPLERS